MSHSKYVCMYLVSQFRARDVSMSIACIGDWKTENSLRKLTLMIVTPATIIHAQPLSASPRDILLIIIEILLPLSRYDSYRNDKRTTSILCFFRALESIVDCKLNVSTKYKTDWVNDKIRASLDKY